MKFVSSENYTHFTDKKLNIEIKPTLINSEQEYGFTVFKPSPYIEALFLPLIQQRGLDECSHRIALLFNYYYTLKISRVRKGNYYLEFYCKLKDKEKSKGTFHCSLILGLGIQLHNRGSNTEIDIIAETEFEITLTSLQHLIHFWLPTYR